jgi:hypothetical protein
VYRHKFISGVRRDENMISLFFLKIILMYYIKIYGAMTAEEKRTCSCHAYAMAFYPKLNRNNAIIFFSQFLDLIMEGEKEIQ